MLPARRWIESSRAQPRAAVRLGPSSGSAPATSSAPPASRFHFSGRATNAAPSAAASRTRPSAVAGFRTLSAVELSCTAATRKQSLLELIDQSIGRLSIGGAAPGFSLGIRFEAHHPGDDAIEDGG